MHHSLAEDILLTSQKDNKEIKVNSIDNNEIKVNSIDNISEKEVDTVHIIDEDKMNISNEINSGYIHIDIQTSVNNSIEYIEGNNKSSQALVVVDSEVNDIKFKISSNHAILGNMLGLIDSKVKNSCQLAQATDTVRIRTLTEDKKINQFKEANNVLKQRMKLLQKRQKISEKTRKDDFDNSHNNLLNMEREEKELLEKLKKVREEINNSKKDIADLKDRSLLGKLAEKAQLSIVAKENDHCNELLNASYSNIEILKEFNLFVTSFDVNYNSAANNACTKIVNMVEELFQTSPSVLYARLMYEGLRLTSHLLEKYYTSSSNVQVLKPQILTFRKLMARCDHVYPPRNINNNIFDNNISDTIASNDNSSNIDIIKLEIDNKVKINQTNPPKNINNVTIVLCDPRNLRHCVPKKMPERSMRIVKIMTKLCKLQLSIDEIKIKKEEDKLNLDLVVEETVSDMVNEISNLDEGNNITSSEIEDIIPSFDKLSLQCLSVDERIPIQDCFWECVSLAHGEEYIEFLKKRISQASLSNPPYIPLKDHAIIAQAEEETDFNLEVDIDIPFNDNDIKAVANESGKLLIHIFLIFIF